MHKYLTLSLIVTGLSVATASFAAGDNNDSHHKADSQAVFKKLDSNGDGKLTAAEMTRLPQVMKQQMMAKIDSNHDGKIEKSEFEDQAKNRADHMFARLDQNGDGQISANEMTMPWGHHHMKPHKSDDTADNKDHHHHGWHHHGMPSTDKIFAHMDSNNNGYVSASEWNKAAQQWHHHHGHSKPVRDQN